MGKSSKPKAEKAVDPPLELTTAAPALVPEQIEFAAPEFFAGQELPDLEEHARRGRFSGAILERKRELVRAICGALAEGIGVSRIAQGFRVSIHSVMGIRDRNPELIAGEKKALSSLHGRIQRVGWERYLEAIANDEISPGQLPVGLGISADKKALLDGEVTSRTEVVKQQGVTLEDLRRMLEEKKRARVIEVSSSDAQSEGLSKERQ